MRTYYNRDGYYCRQEIDFYLDRRGVDYIRIQYPDGRIREDEYRFNWNWENAVQSSLCMVYGPNDVSYLDEVNLWANRLEGYLDGWDNYVVYKGRL